MAEIRFNYGDKFTQTSDSNTGIGSTIPAGKLDVAGGTSAGSLRVSGIATLSSYQGFVNTKLTPTEDLIVEAGNSGSVSGEVVVSTGQTISVSTGATTGQGGVHSLKVYETFMPPVGGTADRPTDVKPGMVYYNKDFKTIEFWDGNFWKQVDNTTRSGRAVFGGGYTPSLSTNMDFVNIHSLGNANSFGDLNHGGATKGSMGSDGTRGLFMGGYWPAAPTITDQIDYITIAAEGNGIDFGDLSTSSAWGAKGASSSTRGIRMGGYPSTDVIDYVEINTLGNALDFGNLTVARYSVGALASPTKIFGAGGNASSTQYSTIDMITTSSKGNAIDDGDLRNKLTEAAAASNSVRGIWAGGGPLFLNEIQYRTLSSSGNAEYFGDLTVGRRSVGSGASTQTRMVIGGGRTPTILNTIDFVTIASAGNANDFGDLSEPRRGMAALSDSHGGLGGF